MKEIRVFEAFAGIGSQRKALGRLVDKNFKDISVGTSEWDIDAIISYDTIHNGDINKVDVPSIEEIKKFLGEFTYSLDSKKESKAFLRQKDEKLKRLYIAHKRCNNYPDIRKLTGQDIEKLNVDLFTYSFPCQDLSLCGKGAGMKKGDDTRSGLLWEIERIMDEVNNLNSDKLPKFLLMENVDAILSKKYKDDYNLWKHKLEDLGYTTFDGILDAREFGVPQRRLRCYAISIRNYNGKYLIESPNKSMNEVIFKYYKPIPMPHLSEFIMDDYSNEKYKMEADEAQPPHTPYRYKMWDMNKRLYEDGIFKYDYSFTLMTKQDRIPNAGMLEYKENEGKTFRMLSPRECFLLMGFAHEDYDKILKVGTSRERRYRQPGNSIVVNVLEQIFKIFIKEIDD